MVGLVALAVLAVPAAAVAQRAPVGGGGDPACTIVGTPHADVLVGTPGDDVICGLGGNDRLYGGGGNDILRGGPGADLLQGGSGDDVLRGNEGADVLRGGSGNDELYAGRGDDEAQGGEGNDTIWGGPGDDHIGGGPGRDTIRAVDGPDFRDVVRCGSGERDRAFADPRDDVSDNCESNSQNTAPHAVDDGYATTEDTTLSLPVSGAGSPAANDTDAQGDLLSVAAVSSPVGGTVLLSGGTITFAPTHNLCGPTAGHFDYTVSDGHGGTDVGRVTVAITCTPDDPIAADDLAMVFEDSGPTSLAVLANDQDPDGDPLVIASRTNPAHGTVTITGGGTGLTYAPDPNYCNAPPGTAPDTFTYTLTPGGSTATVTLLVLCADDAPVAVDDSATVAQDVIATPIDVLANDTDIDGGPKTIASTSDPAHGTVQVTGGGTGLTYAPDAGYCNNPPGTTPDTFTYTLAPGGSTATVSVTVTCPDSPPTAVDDSATVAEDSGATSIDVLANDTDTDGGPKTIASVTQPANGTVVITGGGTGLTYAPDANYCNAPPGTALDTFTYTLNGGSTATVSVLVTCVDDAPTAVGDAASVTEDASATTIDVLANDTDVDGGPKAIASVTQPAHGTVVNNGTDLTYAPQANYCNHPAASPLDTFTYTLTPGGSTATVTVTVDCAPDAPAVTTSSGALSYTENDPAAVVDPAVTVTDPDSTTLTSATVSITGNFHSGEDMLALANAGTHAAISGSYDAGTGVLTLTGSATPAAYEAALRDVTYANGSDAPSTATRTVTFTATDDTALSGSGTRGITVTATNDAPTAMTDSGSTDEDTTLTVAAPGVLANDTDPDPSDTATVVKLNGSGTLTGTSTKGAAVTINANGSYSYDPGSIFQSLSTGQSDTDTFSYTMADGAGLQSTATVTITITGVSDAPTAATDSFDAIGNTGLFVGTTQPAGQAGRATTGSVLTNDTDPDTPHASLVAEPVTNAATALGGTITILADGSFTYHPGVGDTGVTDTFTYRVCDATPCNSGTVANATGTLNLPIAGQVWYVKNNQAAGGDGTSAAPFDTLAEAETASGAGDTTFVYAGDGTSTNLDTGYLLDAGERLIGEVSGLSLDPDGGGPLPQSSLYAAVPGARPTITATNKDVVSLATGSVVRGLQLDPSGTGGGIAGGSGDAGGTIDDVRIIDTGVAGSQPGLELNGTSGTFDVSDLVVDSSATSGAGTGILLNNAGTVNFASAGTISVTSKGAKALDASGTSLGAGSVFDALTVTGSANGAVSMTNTTGTTTFGDLSLATTSGAAGAFVLNNAGSVTVPAAGTANVSAVGGPAVDVSATANPSLTFDSVSSTGSASTGVSLSALGTGTFAASGGTLSGASGTALAVSGPSSGAISYAGAIGDGAGSTASITGRTGGVVTLSGSLTDSADAGGGVAITSNTGGSTVLSGPSKTFSTGTSPAISLSSNTGHTVTISGGGLALTATSGTGLAMTGGGTLNVTGAGNTISTTSGGALLIDNSTIGGGDATFQSVSTNGASVGIRANNTGGSGRLIVTGNGGTCVNGNTSGCSGGTIANSTGADDSGPTPGGTGIVLNSTLSPSFTRMYLHDHSNYAIRGTSVSGLTLANSVISGSNGDNGTTPYDDSSVLFSNLTGSAAVSDTYVSGGYEDNVRVSNSSGSLNRITFTNDTFGASGTRPTNDALNLNTTSTAGQLQATVTGSTFASAAGDLLQYNHAGTGTGDLALSNNAFSNVNPAIASGGGGLSLFSDGAGGNTTMSVDGNTFRDAVGNALTIVKTTGPATQAGTFSNNTVGVFGSANSGSAEGDGIKIQTVGQGTQTWAVTGNQIHGFNNVGIEVLAGGGATSQSGAVNSTITGNTIDQPGNTASTAGLSKYGVMFNIGTVSGDSYQACAAITGNSLAASGLDAVPATGLGDIDVRLRQRQSTTITLPGYTGANGDNTAVAGFVAGNNASGGPTVTASNTAPTGGGYVNGGACALP